MIAGLSRRPVKLTAVQGGQCGVGVAQQRID
jgi:hypothetical protein